MQFEAISIPSFLEDFIRGTLQKQKTKCALQFCNHTDKVPCCVEVLWH